MSVPRVYALPRPRLHDTLIRVFDHRLGLVVAPAGSGKTTLLAQFAASAGVPVAWYRAEPADASAAAAVAHLERGLVAALGVAGGWAGVDDGIEALDAWRGDRALIAVDDLHVLWGTEAEATLERLLRHLPPGVVMVAATRRAPLFNLSRLAVSGELVELGQEDLRFRAWEVERLFHEFYGEQLRPDELAELARRTDGWAAGLQLFHLATRGKAAGERRRVLRELGVRSRLVREYLTRNVLGELPLHIRDFLLQTCVLGRLTAALCDELTGAGSSDVLLAELEQRQVFTAALEDEVSYRYHEVLRSHLEAVLIETVGEAEARARYRRAGRLLEAAGHLPEALRAYSRAEDWEAATSLLGGRGEQVIDRPGEWIETLPPALLEHDPWLLLASARRQLAVGRWEAAVDTYERAEAASLRGQPADTSRREREAVAAWFVSPVSSPSDWPAVLRLAVDADPLAVVQRERGRLDGPTGDLARGLAALLAGHLADATRRLDALAGGREASEAVALVAGIGAALARRLAGVRVAPEVAALCESAEAAGLPWLAGVARVVAGMDEGDDEDALDALVVKDEAWGTPLVQLCTGLGRLWAGRNPGPRLAQAADGFAASGAQVVEAWARAASALACTRWSPGTASAEARLATVVARRTRSAGPAALAALAAALADPAAGRHQRDAAAAGLADLGVDVARFVAGLGAPTDRAAAGGSDRAGAGAPPETADGPATGPGPGRPPPEPGSLRVRCFGPLAVEIGGRPVDLRSIKPRVRSLLRLLAMEAGRPVHRDRLVDSLWPGEADSRVGTRNLQVAISALRQHLEPGVARGAAALVVREGDTYRLNVAGDALDVAA
ncbi:MAG TPA: winged helix-turn-helix domain-containing protein, partial [Acidimicrobiales bacterium]|nr:winged helix-turn-helix domain-containing protein [Acidimicrobiales bacterium]